MMNLGDKLRSELGVNQEGKMVFGREYGGKKLALYFYPKDMTAGCTKEACNLRDNYASLEASGYAILGVSVDGEASHQKFKSRYELPFDLISDTEHRLCDQFGVWVEKNMYGRKYMGVARSTFLFDEQGVLQRIIGPKSIKVSDHAAQILDKGY